MQTLLRTLALPLCLGLIFFSTLSCARVQEYVRENPQTAIGAGVGTAGGALLGGLVFDSAGAAIAGGLLGGLAGGVIGNALESKNEDYASTAKDYNFTSREKTLVRIEDVDADPPRLTSRDTVHLIARYALLPAERNEKVKVTERWEITHVRKVLANPAFTVTRTRGTWSSAVPLRLPSSADDGVYRARVEVHAAGAADQGSTTFTIR